MYLLYVRPHEPHVSLHIWGLVVAEHWFKDTTSCSAIKTLLLYIFITAHGGKMIKLNQVYEIRFVDLQ